MTGMNLRAIIVVLILAVGLCLGVQAGTIQDAIDLAKPGEVIEIPAGVYEESIVLKEGVSLMGAGADLTFIDGGGAEVVVTGAKDALIAGFTVRNGETGIAAQKAYMGVFDCRVADNAKKGIFMESGSGVVYHCLVENNKMAGMMFGMSNPYVTQCAVIDNISGILSMHNYSPVVENNYIGRNKRGVQVGLNSAIQLSLNTFFKNEIVDAHGQKIGETDESVDEDFDFTDFFGEMKDAAYYRSLMDMYYEKAAASHAVVIYNLSKEIGLFGVTTLFPWPNFNMAPCYKDTEIEAYKAYDKVTAQELKAEYVEKGWPRIDVKGNSLPAGDMERYVLDMQYDHPASLSFGAGDNLIFKRETSLTVIDVVIPEGYVPVKVNLPAECVWKNGQIVVKMVDIGLSQVEIEMTPIIDGMIDPYGLLVAP
ncbi:MAG: right-handed parallel beta-helix repeat-containing protein [Candidatus Sumerlaeia bacterium]